ncbi:MULTISPECIES: phospholipase D-like domain-containing protein [unclassified Caballeronia]|uniref:phospholipase D-like domain-containing protein n=1 Tax=unclassified Caballeronia TaxID=2646786 RepID=UPI002028A60D|nr:MULTISPECIES: phospholipase D family protein [unclassified Caballeronia]
MADIDLVYNTDAEPRHMEAITQSILSANRIVICSGWLKMGGLRCVLPQLQTAISNGAEIAVYVNDKTSKDAKARKTLKAMNLRFVVVDTCYMHSKLYYFETCDRFTAFVGSANITHGAMTTNEELSVKITGLIGEPIQKELQTYLDHLSERSKANISAADRLATPR